VPDTSTSTHLLAELRGRRSDREAEINERRREVGLDPVSLQPPVVLSEADDETLSNDLRDQTVTDELRDESKYYAYLFGRAFQQDPRHRLTREQARAVLAHLGPHATIARAADPRLWLGVLNLTKDWVGSAEEALASGREPDVDRARRSLAMTRQLLATLEEWSASEVEDVEHPDRSAKPQDPDH
jgi:hypothetical protein